MGRKSIKEEKNIYQLIRENNGLSREAVEELSAISSSRLVKIESDASLIRPEEVLILANCYKETNLWNHYCATQCPIGQKYIQPINEKSLSQITLEIIDNLNNLEKEKNRLVEITVDGQISEEEKQDFENIQKILDKMEQTIASLKLWLNKQTNN